MTSKILMFFFLCCLSLMIGCCHKVLPINNIKTDSILHNKKVELKVTTRLIPVPIKIPSESHSATTKKDSSHLETSLATSNAKINADGSLYHDITNKPTTIEGSASVTDTVYIIQENDKSIQRDYIEVPIKMPLKWWEKTLICIGIISLGAGATVIILKFIKLLPSLRSF